MLNYFNTLSDFINRILLAQKSKLNYIFLNYSSFIFNILIVLKSEGYIKNIYLLNCLNIKIIIIRLKYYNEEPAIRFFKKAFKSNIRIYKGYRFIPKYMNGLGIIILSTNNGILTDKSCRNKGIGGELICYVF